MGTQGSASGRLRASSGPPSQGSGARELPRAPYRVLVVDDDEPLVRQWQRLLEEDAVLVSVPTYEGGWERTDREIVAFRSVRLRLSRSPVCPTAMARISCRAFTNLDPKPAVAVITGLLDAQRTLELRNRCAIAIPKPADGDVLRGILAILERDRRGGSAVREFAATYRLSNQETRLLDAAVQELTNEQAAEVLGCAHSTVRSYWSRIFEKIGCHSERDVVARLLRYAQESNARSSQSDAASG